MFGFRAQFVMLRAGVLHTPDLIVVRVWLIELDSLLAFIGTRSRGWFYPRDAMLARVFAIATCLSVCLSVRPSVCHTPVLCLAERKQDREMYTIW